MPRARFCLRCGTPLEEREVDGEPRLACPDGECGHVHWDNPVPVVAAIIEHDGDVVLARNHAWPPKMFGLVTGFLERGEDPAAGVIREVKEELDLDGEVVSLVGVYPFEQANQVILAYHVRATGEITLGDEIAETKSIPPEKLKPWPFGTGHAVKDWLVGRAD